MQYLLLFLPNWTIHLILYWMWKRTTGKERGRLFHRSESIQGYSEYILENIYQQ